jgi:hypothetical protein
MDLGIASGDIVIGSGCEKPRISVIDGCAAFRWLRDTQCTPESDCEGAATVSEIYKRAHHHMAE